jgi:hypothetical protein
MALTDNQPKERFSRLHYFFFLIRRNPLMILGLLIILTFLIVTVTAPLLASHDPIKINPRDRLTAPNLKHLFGTDEMGRDIFSRIVYGTRITLQMGLTVIIAALLMGSFLGILAGFFGGFIDELIMRLTDIFMSFPYLVLAMVLTVIKELLYNETKTVDIVTIGLRDRERSLVLNIKYGGWASVCDFSSISSSSLSALVRRSSIDPGGLDSVLAGAFGAKQRVICGRQQVRHVISVIRESGHAQAGSNANLKALVAQENLISYSNLNFLCLRHGMSLIKAGQDNHELISGVGYGVCRIFEGFPYGCGHLFNGAAAVEMAVRVHHGFETVEIHENDGHNRSVGLGMFDQVGQRLI